MKKSDLSVKSYIFFKFLKETFGNGRKVRGSRLIINHSMDNLVSFITLRVRIETNTKL